MKVDLKTILTDKQYDEVMYVVRARAKKQYLLVEGIFVDAKVDDNKPRKTYPYPLDIIHEAVLGMFDKTIDITVKTRKPEVVLMRQVFHFFALLYSTYEPQTLEEWTGWDRCTFYHSRKRIMEKYDTEPYFRIIIDDIDQRIRSHLNIQLTRISKKGIVTR